MGFTSYHLLSQNFQKVISKLPRGNRSLVVKFYRKLHKAGRTMRKYLVPLVEERLAAMHNSDVKPVYHGLDSLISRRT